MKSKLALILAAVSILTIGASQFAMAIPHGTPSGICTLSVCGNSTAVSGCYDLYYRGLCSYNLAKTTCCR